MAETKNLCAQIPLELHAKVCGEREQREQTTSQYITELLMEYYEMKENGGKTTMANNGSRTMELFQRIKQHLERESARSGRKVTQREFVLSLIEEALEQAEEEAAEKEATQEKCGEDAYPAPAGHQQRGGPVRTP